MSEKAAQDDAAVATFVVDEERGSAEPSSATEGPPEGSDNNTTSSPKETAAAAAVAPPPDGGFNAWLHVVLAHLVYVNTFGVGNSFGVFQQYYTTVRHYEPSNTSWIGGAQMSLLLAVGVLAGRAVDAGYFRAIFIAGVVLQLFGIFMTSLCTEYWQVLLAQGITVGLGNGLIFTPSLSVVSTYFSTKKALAIGIAAAGSATGGLIYPIMVDRMLLSGNVGFPWTMRIMGFVMLAAHLPGLLFFKARIPYRKGGPLVEWSAFKETRYTLVTISFALCFWGILFPFFYIGTYARDHLGASFSMSINLLITTNASGLIGRVLPNFLAVHTGLLNMVVVFGLASALLVFAWQGIHTIPGLFVFAAFYGLAAGALQSLYPALAASLTTDLSKAGTRLGMIMTILGFTTLTGPPIAGALIQLRHGDYSGARAFSASVMLAASLIAFVVRVLKVGWGLKNKA